MQQSQDGPLHMLRSQVITSKNIFNSLSAEQFCLSKQCRSWWNAALCYISSSRVFTVCQNTHLKIYGHKGLKWCGKNFDWNILYLCEPIYLYLRSLFEKRSTCRFQLFSVKSQRRVILRGSSNKEWDFFYSAVNLHARVMKSRLNLARLFGYSQESYLMCYIVPTFVARQH